MNPVIDCLLNHRSIRKYKPDPIEPDKLELILRAGTRAATATNLQMYTFVVIDDRQKLKEFAEFRKGQPVKIAECGAAIVALADQHRIRRWLELHSDREIYNHDAKNFFLSVWDALIALQNMVVAAESLGIGGCYIGSILEMNVREILGAPEYTFPCGLVCLGYPDEERELSMRLPMEAVIHHNEYHLPTENDLRTWYAERDAVWDTVPESRKRDLAKENIHSIPQALAFQRYNREFSEKRAADVTENLKRSGFDLDL